MGLVSQSELKLNTKPTTTSTVWTTLGEHVKSIKMFTFLNTQGINEKTFYDRAQYGWQTLAKKSSWET